MLRLRNFFLVFSKWLFRLSGVTAILFFILSFTDLPYFAYHYLGTCNAKLYYKPDVIVVLGGAGMPSPDGLIRTYYAAEAAKKFPEAKVVIALPLYEGGTGSQAKLMAHELIIRGIDSARISHEGKGFSTHSQAENIAGHFTDREHLSILLVTSPEHMYRSVRAFAAQGFAHVGGYSAFAQVLSEGELTDKDTASGARVKNISVRYNMWSYMNYELLVLREYAAITYYGLKGWI